MHTRRATLLLRLTFACGILLALPAQAMGEITLSGPASVSESAGTATYTVTCGGELLDILAVAVTADPGPAPAATEGDDYADPSLIPPIACVALTPSTHPVSVPIVNDGTDEGNENFSVTANTVPAQTVATTIVDDDPVASIDPAISVTEGDSGTSVANLTVTLASAAAQATTIAYATDRSSAQPGTDFARTSGNLVIPLGETTGTISVPIIGDTVPEATEGFFVNLLSTDNGSLSATQKQAVIGIFDNDQSPFPSVSLPKSASVEEGNTGTGNILFNVKLSSAATQRTEVAWKTASATANKADYEAANGTVVFKTGQTSKTISIDVKSDRRDEPDEAFTVKIQNPVSATLGRAASAGIIEDDDGPKMTIGKPRLRGERLVAKVGCPDSADGCLGKLVAKGAGMKLGRKRFDLDGGETKKLRLKLSDAAQEALAEKRRRAKLIATASDSTGDTRVTKRKARLPRL